MPRSLYRWKSFWFGLFIILSLGWAWWDSHRNFSCIAWVGEGLLWSGDGRISCSLSPLSSTAPFEIQTVRTALDSIDLKSLHTTFKTYTLPHWLFFESALLLWFLFLAWRTRRHRRIEQALTNRPAPGPGHSSPAITCSSGS